MNAITRAADVVVSPTGSKWISILKEKSDRKEISKPVYELAGVFDQQRCATFVYSAKAEGVRTALGSASSKRGAREAAAYGLYRNILEARKLSTKAALMKGLGFSNAQIIGLPDTQGSPLDPARRAEINGPDEELTKLDCESNANITQPLHRERRCNTVVNKRDGGK